MQCSLRRFLSYGVVAAVFLAPSIARADDDDPLPPPAPRDEPRRLGERPRPPPTLQLDRLMGQVGVGAVMLFNTREHAFYQANMGMMGWWRNLGVGGSLSAAHNGSSPFVTVDMGVRGLGSTTNSGPFVGGGFGFRYITLEDDRVGGFRGTKSGAGAYLEAGVIVRGIVTVGLRADLPFFAVKGREPLFPGPVPPVEIVPIAMSAQLGFLL